jgi:hypothetical protein
VRWGKVGLVGGSWAVKRKGAGVAGALFARNAMFSAQAAFFTAFAGFCFFEAAVCAGSLGLGIRVRAPTLAKPKPIQSPTGHAGECQHLRAARQPRKACPRELRQPRHRRSRSRLCLGLLVARLQRHFRTFRLASGGCTISSHPERLRCDRAN